MQCQKCGAEILMPFHCPYCGGHFCSEHRLPESHMCPNIALVHSHRQEPPTVPIANRYEYSMTFGSPLQRSKRVYFSPKELKHLIPAALLILGIGFSIVFYNDFFTLGWSWLATAVFALLLTASFLTHEIAHKVIAQRGGLWAEFRLTTWGAVITLISVFTPFRLIAPGAVMISGPASLSRVGKISVAGPATNLVLAMVFLGIVFGSSGVYPFLFLLLASFNAFIALFNLIPYGIFDGYKIYSWNKMVWALAFAAAAMLTVYTYFFTYV